MAQALDRLADAEADRIYTRRIRPDLLDGVAASPSPTAIVVGGQPGAGKSVALAQVRAHLTSTVGPAVTIAADELREYHPYWRSSARIDAEAALKTQPDAGRWFARLTNEALAKQANVIFETSMRQPEAVVQLASRLRGDGYQVSAVVLTTERDLSRQAVITRYDVARTVGDVPRFVAGGLHDQAFDKLRDTVSRLESERAVDRIQLVTRDGRQLYSNQLHSGHWLQEPKALATLDDFRERGRTARELADSALRWQTLVQRVANDPSVPREVAGQVIAWRNEATAIAERDPDAKQLLQWGREAEAFKTMSRHQFVREFPRLGKAADRLDEAMNYAEANFPHQVDRQNFVAQAREKIAERIAEGRIGERSRESTKDKGARTR